MPLRSMDQAMKEWKSGGLHSGKGGPVVKSQKQAVAIGLSVERRKKGRKAGKSLSRGARR